MRKTKAITTGDSTYVVRELTPNEIDGLFDQSTSRRRTTVDDILDVHHLDCVLLGSMLGVDPERCAEIFGNLTSSESAPLIAAAKELNPDFFAMARRRIELVGQLAGLERMLAETTHASASGSAFPPSSSTDTQAPPTTA